MPEQVDVVIVGSGYAGLSAAISAAKAGASVLVIESGRIGEGVSTLKGNLIVSTRAFHRNPYDSHTLQSQIAQAAILMQDCATAPKTAFADLGYQGVDADDPEVRVVHRGKPNRLTAQERKQLGAEQVNPLGICGCSQQRPDALSVSRNRRN